MGSDNHTFNQNETKSPSSPSITSGSIPAIPSESRQTHSIAGSDIWHILKTSKPVNDEPVLPRSLTWSSSTTIAPLEFTQIKQRVRTGIVLVAEACLQIAASVVILGLAATIFRSPTHPDRTEWEACEYLSIFASIWVIRMCVICGLSYWGFLHDRFKQDPQHCEDLQLMTNLALTGPCNMVLKLTDSTKSEPQPPPYCRFYSSLIRFMTGLSVIWWFGAQILEYRSTPTSSCRRSSPHIWGLLLVILINSYFSILTIIGVWLLSVIERAARPTRRYHNAITIYAIGLNIAAGT